MDPEITPEALQLAFDDAEVETSEHFGGRTCSLETAAGEAECPICYFRRRVKMRLGLIPQEGFHRRDK